MIKSVLLPVTTAQHAYMFEEEKQAINTRTQDEIRKVLAELDQHFNEGYEVKSSHFCHDKNGGFIQYLLHRGDDQLDADEPIPFVPIGFSGKKVGYMEKPNSFDATVNPYSILEGARAWNEESWVLSEFANMVKAGNFVVVDTETTALNGEIVEIAVIDHEGKVLLDSYVKPSCPIPSDATAIHGITDQMVANAPSYPELIDQIALAIVGKDVVVYNAKFDRGRLHESAQRHGLPKTEWKELSRWWCAMEAYAEWNGDWNEYRQSYTWKKLTEAARHFDIPTNGAHSAIADAKMTLAVVKNLAEVITSES